MARAIHRRHEHRPGRVPKVRGSIPQWPGSKMQAAADVSRPGKDRAWGWPERADLPESYKYGALCQNRPFPREIHASTDDYREPRKQDSAWKNFPPLALRKPVASRKPLPCCALSAPSTRRNGAAKPRSSAEVAALASFWPFMQAQEWGLACLMQEECRVARPVSLQPAGGAPKRRCPLFIVGWVGGDPGSHSPGRLSSSPWAIRLKSHCSPSPGHL